MVGHFTDTLQQKLESGTILLNLTQNEVWDNLSFSSEHILASKRATKLL